MILLFCNLIFLAVYHDQGPFTVFFNIIQWLHAKSMHTYTIMDIPNLLPDIRLFPLFVISILVYFALNPFIHFGVTHGLKKEPHWIRGNTE